MLPAVTQRRHLWRTAAVFSVLLAGAMLIVRPPAPQRLPRLVDQPLLWQGAYHVHSTRSDGSGTPEEIAAAARAAGLDFVIITDHGDAMRSPEPPRILDGVLLIDGVEISTDDGHYVALGLPAAPYPLAGAGRAVADDVRRLGGIGIFAHPDSPRRSLAWHDWSVNADGFEWVNADSAWRSASTPQLLTTLLTYPLRASAAVTRLTTYPASLFARLDHPTRRPALALAAVDAHARIDWRREDDADAGERTLLRLPSYRASFGSVGLVVPWHDTTPSGNAARDAASVIERLRARLAYAAIFSMAQPAWLELEMLEPLDTAQPGPDARGAATLSVRGNAPDGAFYRVLRNGTAWRDLQPRDASVRLEASSPAAVYRAELWLPARRGWPALPVAVSAARTHNVPSAPASSSTLLGARRPVRVSGWHGEHSEGSSSAVASAPDGATATLTLAPGPHVSQFAALVADVIDVPADATGVEMWLSADLPMRVSIQVRQPVGGDGLRWRHSAFVDQQPRLVSLPLDEFRAIAPASGPVPATRLHAILFVSDTVNGRPGDARRLTVRELQWTGR